MFPKIEHNNTVLHALMNVGDLCTFDDLASLNV